MIKWDSFTYLRFQKKKKSSYSNPKIFQFLNLHQKTNYFKKKNMSDMTTIIIFAKLF